MIVKELFEEIKVYFLGYDWIFYVDEIIRTYVEVIKPFCTTRRIMIEINPKNNLFSVKVDFSSKVYSYTDLSDLCQYLKMQLSELNILEDTQMSLW